jgi:hypothetical protein
MSSQRTVASLLASLLLVSSALPAEALWREFVLASDRSDDAVILQILDGATLDEKLEIAEALGARAEPYLGAYLDDFLLRASAHPAEAEHLMRVLLEAAFPRQAARERLAVRAAANQEALLAAAARLATFGDPQLCAVVVRLVPLLPGGRSDLLALVERLIEKLARGDGLLDPREDALLLDALEAMARVGSADFLEPALAVARCSREKAVVDRARAVARQLAPPANGR